MRTRRRKTLRRAGAIVAVVLAAAPGAAAPDGALPIPLPEAAGDSGVGDTRTGDTRAGEGAIDVVDATSGGAMAEAVPAKAVPAQTAAGDSRAGDSRAGDSRAGDTRGAETPDAPDTGNMDAAEGAPEPASRLLRALAAPPKPENSRPVGVAAGAAPVYAAEGCPRALLRLLLAGAADDAGALTALGIEREVLTLCRERQEIVSGLFETEARLRELRAIEQAPAMRSAAAEAAPVPVTRERTEARPALLSPLRAALAGPPETLVPETLVPETPVPETPVPEARGSQKAKEAEEQGLAGVSAAPVSPRYAWFSIIGTAGALRAGVTDGTGVWFVREGDALPGGTHVAAIAVRPPAVRVSAAGGTDGGTPLPYRARPGGVP